MEELLQLRVNLSEASIYIDDSTSLNILELRAKARKLKSEKDIDIIFVDYLQLLNHGGRSESRQQEISFISRSLKALAKELDIPIIALSQLSRAVESRSEQRPIMSDLRKVVQLSKMQILFYSFIENLFIQKMSLIGA